MEFQTSNDAEMVYRMAEYKAMLQRKYKVPVRQFVLYLGTQKPAMRTQLNSEEIIDGFQLKNIHEFDVSVILESFVPEEVILAILADYKKSQTKKIIKSVLIRLQELVDDQAALQKYIHQLTILSRLRKLEHQIIEQLKDMSIVYDIKKDKLYREGIEKGIEKEKIEVARKLLKKNFSLEEISEIVSLPVETIREISV